jgi:hypothetical protein
MASLSYESVPMQAWLRKRMSHFSSEHGLSQDLLSSQLSEKLQRLWYERIKARDESVSELVRDFDISREEAHRLWSLQLNEESYGLFLASFGDEARGAAQKADEEAIRSVDHFEIAARSPDGSHVGFSVDESRIEKMKTRFGTYQSYIDEFVADLRQKGPFHQDVTVKKNFQKTTGWYSNTKNGWTHFHCHLKGGHPTMVVGFWVKDRNSHEVIVDYWGTHEGVHWGNH